MGTLIQFLLKLFGLGDAASIEKLIKDVLLKKTGGALTGGTSKNPLEDLMNQFKDKGLGNIFQSWVGKGANHLITPDQIKHGIGNDQMAVLSSKAGIPIDELAQKLSKYLPGLIDKMTPGGTIHPG